MKEAIISVIAHRIKLKPSVEYLQSPKEFVQKELDKFIAEHPELSEKGGFL